MVYVYIIRSQSLPSQTYIGLTNDLRRRLADHNGQRCEYTSQFAPWRIETYLAFTSREKAFAFERFLKKSGGWRFAQRRLIGGGGLGLH